MKGLDFAYKNGSSAKSVYYPDGRVIYLGKSSKKKIHVVVYQFYSDYLCGLNPHLAVAAAN